MALDPLTRYWDIDTSSLLFMIMIDNCSDILFQAIVDVLSNILEESNLDGWRDLQMVGQQMNILSSVTLNISGCS